MFSSARSTMTIKKWIPINDTRQQEFVQRCVRLRTRCNALAKQINACLNAVKQHKNDATSSLNPLERMLDELEQVRIDFGACFEALNANALNLLEMRTDLWKFQLYTAKLEICHLLSELISEILSFFIYYGDKYLIITFKFVACFNGLLHFGTKYKLGNFMSIASNSCAYVLYPLRKFSITRLLQILAKRRAENCAHKLIDCLLDTYKYYDRKRAEHNDENDDNSSLEIYMALMNHLSPQHTPQHHPKKPITKVATITADDENDNDDSKSFANLDKLLEYEEQNVLDLLNCGVAEAPNLFGNDAIRHTTHEIKPKARDKAIIYYEEILWGEVGHFLEHIILWWGPSPMARRPPHSSQHLREWILQFTPTAHLPQFIITTLNNLADGLGVHVTSTSWDKHFRLALVCANSKPPDAGEYFCAMLQDLVQLSNQCEVTNDWIIGAPLDELPLVEQIPVLHRLDHSIHTTRLWASAETKKLANQWRVHEFFNITHCDIVNALQYLTAVRFGDHLAEIEKGGLDVQVEVCAKMREKLVSEVKVNNEKLKATAQECINNLSKIFTTICLAHLQMIFPRTEWRSPVKIAASRHDDYVAKYLNELLSPVLKATHDQEICNMILRLMCEAWLDHIYLNRIHFSEHGAIKLLEDFARVASWLEASQLINGTLRAKMLANEILRRCEGVGRLLLRNPGEKIKMHDGKYATKEDNADEDSDGNAKALMPAEMYVPNQEQWLELRANKKRAILLKPLCCS